MGLVMVGPSENPSIRQKMLEEELRKLKGMVLAELRRFVPIWVLLLVLIGLRLVELGLKCCKDELSWRLKVCQPAAPPTWMVQVRRWQRPLLGANNPRPSSNSLREKSMTSPTSPTPASTSMSAAGTDTCLFLWHPHHLWWCGQMLSGGEGLRGGGPTAGAVESVTRSNRDPLARLTRAVSRPVGTSPGNTFRSEPPRPNVEQTALDQKTSVG